MPDMKKTIGDLLDSLKRERDELALKIHLGKAEAREEWDKLEDKLDALRSKAAPYTDAAGDTAKGVVSALELAGEEIKKGYQRIRDQLKS